MFCDFRCTKKLLLPWQHLLSHYSTLIHLFSAPNGLCSSITESKHIRAVKEPWHQSNQNEALGQILVTNQHLDQLAAACVDFASQGMLDGTCLSFVLQQQLGVYNQALTLLTIILMK